MSRALATRSAVPPTLRRVARPRWIAFDELESRREEWRALARASEFPTAFADPAWVLAWWRTYGVRHDPWAFALEDSNGALRALAVLALEHSARARTLTFAGESWNGLQTPICAPGVEAELVTLLLDALCERSREWDTWKIQRLRLDSSLAQTLLDGGRLRAAARDLRLQPYLQLPSDVESYEMSFGSKQRSTQRRKWRKLSELGAQAGTVAEPVAAARTLDQLLALRRSRATAMGQRHEHMDEAYERFLHAAMRELLPDGARLWRLDLDGELLASRLNLVQGPREHSYLLGLGEGHANLSPGNALELRAIAEAIEQGREEFELGPGRDEYKYRLGGLDRTVVRLVAASPSLRGRALTSLSAVDLRLRDSTAAEALRRRRGVRSERAGAGRHA
jgi:CelD/BcsL family acetyltransferase involved in cellulose biosynthesis